MFKLTLKLTIAAALFVGAYAFLFSSTAMAYESTGSAPECPNSSAYVNANMGAYSPPLGFTQGENDDGYAGLTVSAFYGPDTDGSTSYAGYGNAVDTNFTLSAQMPDLPGGENYVNNSSDPNINDRIFKLNDQNPYGNPQSRNSYHTFNAETSIYRQTGTSNSFTCKGLTVLGPGATYNTPQGGTVHEYGNRWGLDCAQAWVGNGTSGTQNVHYWINIPSAPGLGYWTIKTDFDFYNNGDADANHHYFTVTNGVTQHVYLVWHPKAQQAQPSASCSIIDEYNYGSFSLVNNAGVTITGLKTRTLVETSNPGAINNANGGAIYAYAPGSGGSTTKSDQIWNITATAASFTYYTTREYQQTNGNWAYIDNSGNPSSTASRNAHTISNCYHATCSDTPIGIRGDGPGGIVLANHQYTLTVPVRNDNTDPNKEAIPQSPGGYNFSLTESPDDRQNGYAKHDVGTYLNVGESTEVTMTFTAPNQIRDLSLTFYPDLYGSGAIGGPCSASVRVYQYFNSSLSATSDLKPTKEHPYQGDDYATYIKVANDLSHQVNIPTQSKFYKKPVSGGQVNLASSSNGGPFNSSPGGADNTVWSGHYDIPAGSYTGGDEYCASIHADYLSGYVGPDNAVVQPGAGGDASNCPRVANEPYFKVYNSDIFAGGEFDQCLDNAHGGGGALAGYVDISDPANVTRGASSELSALALIKITGVASAQSVVGRNPQNINRPPTNLTFANHGVTVSSTGNESPTLGGQYDGCRTLTNETAPSTAPTLGAATLANFSGRSGAYKHTGNMTINGGTLVAGQNVSIFVDGDIYIAGPINYGAGWSAGTAPSLILHATGNIYIKPSVTTLSGLYIAQKDGSGNGGKIYTCADGSGFAPMVAKDLYSCNNQLVVYGSFVADQVNLMRTFGSLRDEEPSPGTPGVTAIPLCWTSANHCSGFRRTQINEPADPYTWDDNYLGVDPASSLHLAWTHWPGSPYSYGDKKIKDDPGSASLQSLKDNGFKYCTEFNLPGVPAWDDSQPNWLCMDQHRDGSNDPLIEFSTSDISDANNQCMNIRESVDPSGNWASGYWLCQPISPGSIAGPKGPPFTSCSNKGTEVDSKSCAGEIFEYSPALYLTSPAVQPPGGGSIQFQALTSLPPVL